jgi:chromosome segregation ATPase
MGHLTASQKIAQRQAALEEGLRVLTTTEKKALKEALRLAKKLGYKSELLGPLWTATMTTNLTDEEFYSRWMSLMEKVELSISDLEQVMSMGDSLMSSNRVELEALDDEIERLKGELFEARAKKTALLKQNSEVLKKESMLDKKVQLEYRLHRLLGVIDELDAPLIPRSR